MNGSQPPTPVRMGHVPPRQACAPHKVRPGVVEGHGQADPVERDVASPQPALGGVGLLQLCLQALAHVGDQPAPWALALAGNLGLPVGSWVALKVVGIAIDGGGVVRV